ncbi:hypothetical protein [Rubritalea sp.]|uniref:hypothetical protein n=1 Tax=Rubritalea sp. TaxID=2109375 RepID=UPI003EF721A0
MSPSHLYFFDYPLIDAKAIANTALRFLYYGSAHGAFGRSATNSIPKTRNLDTFDAFKITLTHLSKDPLSDDFEYNLVYFSNTIAKDLWLVSNRSEHPELRKVTRRVHLGNQQSLNAKRYKTPFWVRFTRPIYLSIFEQKIGDDNYVPPIFCQEFHAKYTGFIMRTKKDYPLVRTMFDAYGLEIGTRHEVHDRLDGDLQVISYTGKPL